MFKKVFPLLLTAKATSKVTLTKEFVDGDWAMQPDGTKMKNFVACMDGSMPAYYIKMSENNSEDLPRKWLIYFQGGAICHDEASCDAMVEAFPQTVSSLGWANSIELGGVFSDSPENEMADYNKVFYGYCSGDSHISSKDNLGDQYQMFDKYYMNGYGNTYALFDKLAQKYDFGAHAAGEDIVVGGEGAGAIGAMFALELDDLPFASLL